MREINSYAISWFNINDCKLFCIANIDKFEKPFIRVIKGDKFSDISIEENPKILDGINIEFALFNMFIKRNQNVLLNHWNFAISSDELLKNLEL